MMRLVLIYYVVWVLDCTLADRSNGFGVNLGSGRQQESKQGEIKEEIYFPHRRAYSAETAQLRKREIYRLPNSDNSLIPRNEDPKHGIRPRGPAVKSKSSDSKPQTMQATRDQILDRRRRMQYGPVSPLESRKNGHHSPNSPGKETKTRPNPSSQQVEPAKQSSAPYKPLTAATKMFTDPKAGLSKKGSPKSLPNQPMTSAASSLSGLKISSAQAGSSKNNPPVSSPKDIPEASPKSKGTPRRPAGLPPLHPKQPPEVEQKSPTTDDVGKIPDGLRKLRLRPDSERKRQLKAAQQADERADLYANIYGDEYSKAYFRDYPAKAYHNHHDKTPVVPDYYRDERPN